MVVQYRIHGFEARGGRPRQGHGPWASTPSLPNTGVATEVNEVDSLAMNAKSAFSPFSINSSSKLTTAPTYCMTTFIIVNIDITKNLYWVYSVLCLATFPS